MKNMKVEMKLIISFLIIAVFAAIVGVVGICGMTSMNNSNEKLYEHNLVAVNAIGEIRNNLQAQRVAMRNYILFSGNEKKIQEADNVLNDLETEMNVFFADYEAINKNKSVESDYYNAKNLYLNEFSTIKDNARKAGLISFDASMEALSLPVVASTTTEMVDGFTTAMNNEKNQAHDTTVSVAALYKTMIIIEIAVLILAVAIALILAIYVSRLISKPLTVMSEYFDKVCSTGDMELRQEDVILIGEMSKVRDEIGISVTSVAGFVNRVLDIGKVLETVADGDLTAELALLSENDTTGLSLKRMISNLNDMFGEIYNSTTQVSSGAGQIASGAHSLAQGASEQASAVEQLSSSINEISGKTKENANMAIHAADLGNTIKGNAEKGSHQMEQMMQAVKEINEASQSINKVIKVIDDIAFQTNILALNAAVEAARAGQHGKGFAVVAEEVRNLAAKSAEAAKDTSSLIANSIEKAELGARIAEETASSLTEIVSGIKESSQIVADIANSSEEQSAAIMQINRGIDQVAQVVQQNSATSQQSAAASQELSGQSNVLKNLVTMFKTKNTMMYKPQILLESGKKSPVLQNMPSQYDNNDFGKF